MPDYITSMTVYPSSQEFPLIRRMIVSFVGRTPWMPHACFILEYEHHYWITSTEKPKIGDKCLCGEQWYNGDSGGS